jgi:excisionase family DNA binding protein
MTAKINDDSLYDVPALASILGVTERTIRVWLRAKKFKGKKLGKKWFVPGSAVKAYFEEQNHQTG